MNERRQNLDQIITELATRREVRLNGPANAKQPDAVGFAVIVFPFNERPCKVRFVTNATPQTIADVFRAAHDAALTIGPRDLSLRPLELDS